MLWNKSDLVYNLRDGFTVTFTKKVTATMVSKLKSQIIKAWKLSKPEYATCGCLTIGNTSHIEEVVDGHGKSYWQLTYFLKKNSTVLESMTNSALNLTILKSALQGLTNAKGNGYGVVDTALVNVKRLSLANHLYLSRETSFQSLKTFTETEWSKQGGFGNKSVEVEVIRMERFFDAFWRQWWRAEYFLHVEDNVLDPAVLPELKFGIVGIQGSHGNVSVRSPSTLSLKTDYSWSFSLTVNKEVQTAHLESFKEAVMKYWTTLAAVPGNVKIDIPEQVKMISKKGTLYWTLPIFVYDNDSKQYLDARVHADLNRTTIQNSVEAGVTKGIYKLVEVSDLRRYDSGFTFYLSSFVKRTHLPSLSTHIAQLWQDKDFGSTSKVTVSIVKQEQSVITNGHLASKMIYFLQVNNTEKDFSQMSDLDPVKIGEAVTKVTGQKTAVLNVVQDIASGTTQTNVSMATAYSFSSLLSLPLSKSILDQDKQEVETQLAKAWLSQMSDRRAITVSLQQHNQIRINVPQNLSFDEIRVGFSTVQKQGILLQCDLGNDVYLGVKVSNTGGVAFYVESGGVIDGIWTTYGEGGVDYTRGEYHVVQIRTRTISDTQWTVYLQVDDGEEYQKTMPRPTGNVTALHVGTNNTNGYEGFVGQIFLVQIGEINVLRRAFTSSTPSDVKLTPANLNASIYSIDQNTAQSPVQGTVMVNIKDILHLSAKVLYQDEVVTENGRSLWNVKYTVTINNKEQVTSISELSANESTTFLNVTRSGSNETYKYAGTTDKTFSYKDLYHIHLDQRVATQDYQAIQTNLTAIWKTVENLTQSVTVKKQEEVIDSKGRTYWKLSYHITSKDSSAPINPRLVAGVSTSSLTSGVVVNTPLGARYKVSKADQTYRLSQAYSFIVSRRIRLKDEVKVKAGLMKLVKASVQGVEMSALRVFAMRTDRMVEQSSGHTSWQYSYIMAVNGTTLDASRTTDLADGSLNQTLSGVDVSYRVEVNGVFQSYTNMFGLTLVGQVSVDIAPKVRAQLSAAWKRQDGTTVIRNLTWGEFIGENGTTLTKYQYFVERNGSVLYPTLTKKAETDLLTKNLSVTVYNGQEEIDYQDCHRLPVQGYRGSFDTAAISHTIRTTWQALTTSIGSPDSQNYSVSIVKKEEEVGKYGLKLLTLVYTVVKDTMTLTPDYQSPPARNTMATAWTSSGQSGQVYRGQQETFRMSGLFHLGLQHKANTTEVTQTDRARLENLVQSVWHVSVSGGVSVNIVVNQKFRTKENSATMNKLFYTVKIDGKVTENWENSLPDLDTKISAALLKSSDLKTKFNLSKSYGGRIRSVFLKGGIRVNETLVSQALTQAWQQNTIGGMPELTIISQEKFVTSLWDFFTMKVQYVVSINQSDPEDAGVQQPTYDEIEASLTTVNLGQCGQMSLKYNKVHVQGSPSMLNFTRVAQAMQATWTTKNTEIASMLSLSIKQQSNRNRRAASDSYRLVDDNGHEISPLEYTVALNQEEPSSMYVDTPTDQEVNSGLSAAGTGLCMCSPRLAAQLKVKGQVSENDKDKVTAAVKEAFLKKNPDLNDADLDIELSITNVTDPTGKRSSDVDYIVTRKDNGDVEDLIRPDEAQLTSNIQSMYSKIEKVEEEDKDDWIIPVAVACGVFVFILIVIIICYVIYIRRHRKKGDLVKQEDDVRNRNSFDKEHFSDPAMYDDQGPLKYDNPAYDNKLYL